METFVSEVDFPTNMAFAPDGRLFFAEKNTGRVRIIRDGRLLPRPFARVPSTDVAESGLLGIALHPDFPDEPWVYLYYSSRESDRNTLARVRANGDRGRRVETLLELLPVNPYHDGGDIAFGPDGRLYAITGEAHQPDRAQDPGDVGGKVLRLDPDGSVPGDNPFGGDNPAFSIGHRNSFGICFDPRTGNLWETENGPQGDDEVNLIRPGGNYGWPQARGPGGGPRLEDPVIHFPQTIVPTGCVVYTAPHLGPRSDGALFFGDFQGTIHRALLSEDRTSVRRHHRFLTGLPGITDLATGPDGRLYIATQESILRVPREVPEPAPSPEPEPGPTTPTPAPTESPAAAAPEDGGFPWVPVAVGAGVAAVVALGATALARRR